ncbi:hypothetical protein [Deinococcus marmoris]|uniref:Spore coat protein U domain-containing protein n=1 Tax=Deinococcus marmoris TaxID=249408 RepID=A0A1U7P0E2_9DEIO|nr:hypothetical protein [Deinococcus marmoris]OLV18630.1 hypothetical protein BOO71_0005224 [Deinococcus marmoris]
MFKVVTALLPLLLVPSALAASATATIPVNATTQSACQFDTANNSPTIDLPDYEAALASTYVADQAQVSISVYCNKGTPLSARKIGGSALATTRASAVTIPLALDGVANNPTVNALVWYTVGGSNTVPNGAFKGATRYVSVVRSGWPQAAQFSTPTGFYSGTVDFTVEF